MRERGGFVRFFAGVLAKRLYPHTDLRAPELARALGVTPETVHNWLNGVNGPWGWHLVEMIRFFDAGFATEVLAGTGVRAVKLAAVPAADSPRERSGSAVAES